MTDGRDERVEGGHVDVVALVLGEVEGRARAEMAAHVLGCAACRGEYDEIAAAVSDVLPAVPAVQPPLGFDEHVLRRLGVGEPGRLRARRRWPWLAAAAAVAVFAVAGVLGWVATRSADEQVGDEVSALTLSDGGAPVGTVSLADVDGEPVMVVAITSAPEGVSYLCRTTFADGTTAESDAWPPGAGAWIVPLPPDHGGVDTVEIVVSGTDHVWSHASFGAT